MQSFLRSIGLKISLLSSLLIIVACVATRWVGEELGTDVLIKHELIDNDDDTHLGGRSIQANILALREDATALARGVGAIAAGPDTPGRAGRVLKDLLDKDGNSVGDEGPATRTKAGYRRAGVMLADGGGLRPLWVEPTGSKGYEVGATTEQERRRRIETGPDVLKALAPGARRVQLSEIDPDTREIHAVVPIDGRGGGGPRGVVVLCLDLKPKIDDFVQDARSIAFIADGDTNGTLIDRSPDVALKSTPVAPGVRPTIKDIDGLDSEADPGTGPLLPRKIGSPEKAGSLKFDAESTKGGKLNIYRSPTPLHMMVLDIDKPNNPAHGGYVELEYLIAFQKFLDVHRGDSLRGGVRLPGAPILLTSRGLAHHYTPEDYYPYVYARSTEGELRRIRELLEQDVTLARHATPRVIFPCPVFNVRIIRLPIDPEDPTRSLLLGVGISQEELKADFRKEAGKFVPLNVLILVGGVVVSVAFSRYLTIPLKRMTRAAEAFAVGGERLALPTKSRDEIGVLARAFKTAGDQILARTAELNAALARSRTILDMAAEGIITINTAGLIESFNKAAERILGYSADEVIGRSVHMLLPSGADGQSNELTRLVELGGTQPDQVVGQVHLLTGRRKDGSEFPMEIAIGEVDLGDRRLYTSIVRDITERQQAEAALHASEERLLKLNEELDARVQHRTAEVERAKIELEQSNQVLSVANDAARAAMQAQVIFFEQVSHDLRTPLTNVIGYGKFMLKKATKAGQNDMVADLKTIVIQGEFLNDLINDLLNVSKAMSGKELALNLAPFDVPTMLAARMPGIDYFAQQNGNTVELDCPADLGVMVADEVRVWRILMNLLTNACKFTEEGTIRVSARRESGLDGDTIVLRVSDTGSGMAPDQVARLFNRFEQVGMHMEKGFGIGLSTCALYCRAMSGEIRVESAVGVGSTFIVRLPAVVTRAGPAGPVPHLGPGEVPSRPPLAGTRPVLIVDDDRPFGELLRRNLAAQGVEAVIARSGEEGLRLAKQVRPSAILLDVVMPGIDGWAVLAALKTDAETASIPIIMVTIVDDRARGYALGADDFATKPISPERLADLLRKHMVIRRAGQTNGGPGRVLVVEDDADARDLLLAMLREHGFEAVGVGDGAQALRSIEDDPPDLVLLDLMLPRMDGFEVVKRLRADGGSSRSIPIIVVTGADLDPEARLKLRGQVAQIVQKGPQGQEDLFREVCTLFEEIHRRASGPKEAAHA